jgi:hypothetical protein
LGLPHDPSSRPQRPLFLRQGRRFRLLYGGREGVGLADVEAYPSRPIENIYFPHVGIGSVRAFLNITKHCCSLRRLRFPASANQQNRVLAQRVAVMARLSPIPQRIDRPPYLHVGRTICDREE